MNPTDFSDVAGTVVDLTDGGSALGGMSFDAVGSTCYITGNGTVLAAFAIAPGTNVVTVPAGASEYTAAGPTVDGKSVLQDGVGLN